MVQHGATIQRKENLSLKNTVYIGHHETLLARMRKGWQSYTMPSHTQKKVELGTSRNIATLVTAVLPVSSCLLEYFYNVNYNVKYA